MLCKDVIPITYLGGTGGNFLCHFIVSAKRNIKDVIILSNYGNAHKGLREIKHPEGEDSSDSFHVNWIISHIPDTSESTPPYYTCSHVSDMDLIYNTFEKSIRITYEADDIPDITTIFYKKWAVDHRKTCDPNYLYEKTLSNEENLPKFSNMEKTMPNVLFISWKELFKENSNDLIQKISTFTSIDFDNFSKESLNYWRNKTQYCIEK